MFDSKITRRGLVATAATGVAAAGLLGASAKSADAYQGNMEHAIRLLNQASQALHAAPSNKGGHKANAVNLIQQAIGEVQAGIDFADDH